MHHIRHTCLMMPAHTHYWIIQCGTAWSNICCRSERERQDRWVQHVWTVKDGLKQMMPFDKERSQKRHRKMLRQEENRQAARTDESKQARGRGGKVWWKKKFHDGLSVAIWPNNLMRAEKGSNPPQSLDITVWRKVEVVCSCGLEDW